MPRWSIPENSARARHLRRGPVHGLPLLHGGLPVGRSQYEWSKAVPRVRKCILCYGRLKEGRPTACSEACPTGATKFGNREELLAEAKKRIAAEPKKYEGVVLGEHEVGGTSVFFLADIAFARLGFPSGLPQEKLPERTYQVLSKLPGVILVGGAFLYGMHWLTDRKNELALESPSDKKGG